MKCCGDIEMQTKSTYSGIVLHVTGFNEMEVHLYQIKGRRVSLSFGQWHG